jgi:molybdenum cofactor cytidylyltransferase
MSVYISAIVLAAGQSKRMRNLKQLLYMGSQTLLERALDTYIASTVSQVIVVVGAAAEEVVESIGQRPVDIIVNERYKDGMSTSMIKGLEMVDEKAAAVLFALVDQPFVDSTTIDRLIDGFISGEKGIVVPVYQGRRGNPVIFDIKYRRELQLLSGDRGGKTIVECHFDDVLEVEVNCRGVVEDIDTVDEYNKACDDYRNR